MTSKICLLIVDEHPLFRQGVRFYLESIPDLELSGEAENGADALSFLTKQNVDVVLMDIQMPGLDGVEITKKIKEEWPDWLKEKKAISNRFIFLFFLGIDTLVPFFYHSFILGGAPPFHYSLLMGFFPTVIIWVSLRTKGVKVN